MFKLVTAVLASIFVSMSATSIATADLITNADLVAQSTNPWMALDNLPKEEQLELVNFYKSTEIPDAFLLTSPASTPSTVKAPRFATLYDWNVLNQAAEFLDCIVLTNLNMCNSAKVDADNALASAAARFPSNTLHNGSGDAYRHCYWSGLMTHHIGSGNALAISENHEIHNPGPLAEYQMDTFNNTKGRQAGLNTVLDSDVRYTCFAWAGNGTLIKLF